MGLPNKKYRRLRLKVTHFLYFRNFEFRVDTEVFIGVTRELNMAESLRDGVCYKRSWTENASNYAYIVERTD